MLTKKPVLSIIIVTHNNEKLIIPLLKSVEKASKALDKKTEVIVVDNASTDETINLIKKFFKEVKLIENKKNLGFASANNQGLMKACGDYLLLLNSDTLLKKNTLLKMVSYLNSHKEVGVVTCKVVLPNGEVDLACHRGFPTPLVSLFYFLGFEKLFPKSKIFSSYHLLYKPLNTIHEIDSPSGAFYLVRSEVLKTVGLLDENFFMYGEDLDWSYRIKKAGWKIIYNPTTKIVHLKKQSGIHSQDLKTRIKTISAFYESMKIFYKKHYLNKYPKLVNFFIFRVIDLKKTIDLFRLKKHGLNYCNR